MEQHDSTKRKKSSGDLLLLLVPVAVLILCVFVGSEMTGYILGYSSLAFLGGVNIWLYRFKYQPPHPISAFCLFLVALVIHVTCVVYQIYVWGHAATINGVVMVISYGVLSLLLVGWFTGLTTWFRPKRK